jgi:hypothetical protein
VTLGFTSSGDQAWRAGHSSPNASSGVDIGAISADPARAQVYICGGELLASGDHAEVVTIGYTA